MNDYTQNPDYPNTLTGTFAQYTTQGQQQMNQGFYYGGYGNGIVDMGARRMDGTVQQNPVYAQPNAYGYPQPQYQQPPVQQPIPTGVGQMLNAQEQGVQPFSSYPPSGPNAQPGFNNLMVDARRADAYAAQATGNNPWAANATPAPQPVQPMPQMYQQYPTQYPAQYPQNQNAVFTAQPQIGNNPFEKKPGVNMWDNMYVQPQPYVSPTPNSQLQWQSPAPVQQPPQNMYNFPPQQPNMNPYGYPAPPTSNPQNIPWTDISKKSFG